MEYHLHIDENSDNANAVDILSQASGLTKTYIKQAMLKGAVWVSTEQGTQRLRRHKKALKTGWELHFYYNSEVLATIPQKVELVADEGTYSIWNKPCGILSQGSRWGDHCTVYRWAEQHLQPQRPAFIVHRLDRAANGLIVVAHAKKTAAVLSKMFAERRVEKLYRATVKGLFDIDKLIEQFPRLSKKDSKLVISDPVDNKQANSLVELDYYDEPNQESVLTIQINTGRKHQIRKHLAGLGFPIIGDRLYAGVTSQGANYQGSAAENKPLPDLQLTAFSLSFECPESHIKKHWQID